MSENVLVIKRHYLETDFNLGQEVIKTNFEKIISIFNSNGEFILRNDAEFDLSYKQLIPYIVIKCESEIFLLKRLKKQTEKRLHNQYSIGIGGHINPSSIEGNVILNGLFRELLEEVQFDTFDFKLSLKGLLNDESTEVSKVHLGIIAFLELTSKSIKVLEVEKMEGSWIPISSLPSVFDDLESWSQIVVSNFF